MIGATKRRALSLLMAMVVLAADQASKYWILYGLNLPAKQVVKILPILNFAMVWNHGVTFGLLSGANASTLLVLVAVGAVIFLAVWLWRAPHLSTSLALGAIIGGAIGNVISRLYYGAVVDFLEFHLGRYEWYVFNIADACIVCGVMTLIAENLFRKAPKSVA
jgi:lipoprotein signal peptidase